jgi:transcriptional regulator with XRE-family HTH domain
VSSISKRIKILAEYEGSQTKLANRAGLQNAAISRIINAETSTLRSDTLEALLLAYPNLNARWLLTGQGEVWTDGTPSPASAADPAEQVQTLQRLAELLEQRVHDLEREISAGAPELARRLGLT